MYSELDLIKSLFSEKERELVKAISKVTELTKQIGKRLCVLILMG